MRSEPVAKSACEYPGAAGAHRIKRENLSERSEFIFPPDLRLPTPGTPRSGATNQFCWSSAPTLLLLTFLGGARKVSGCRAAPGNPGPSGERKPKLPKSKSKQTENNKTEHLKFCSTHPTPDSTSTHSPEAPQTSPIAVPQSAPSPARAPCPKTNPAPVPPAPPDTPQRQD